MGCCSKTEGYCLIGFQIIRSRYLQLESKRSASSCSSLHKLVGLILTSSVVFLERLQSYTALPSTHIAHLGKLYSVANTTNAEIRFRFYEVALLDPTSTGAQQFALQAARWVVGDDETGVVKGRMKFCRPVFRAINRVDPKIARDVFGRSKNAFHPIARRLIEKVREMIYLFIG